MVADEEARYQNSFVYRAGYLPRERFSLTEWHRNARLQGKLANPKSSPAVNKMRELIYSDQILRMYVSEMIDQVPEEHKVMTDIEQMLHHLATVVVTAPEYHPDPNQCHFFPMWEVFAYMMGTPAGMHVFRDYSFNEAIRDILEVLLSRTLITSLRTIVHQIAPTFSLSNRMWPSLRNVTHEILVYDRCCGCGCRNGANS